LPARKPPLKLPPHARHQTDLPPNVRSRNALTKSPVPNPNPSYHRETVPTPKTRSPRTPARTLAGVTRRTTSCNDRSNLMCHCVRNSTSEWKRLGASE
jgi:hypothetical protein